MKRYEDMTADQRREEYAAVRGVRTDAHKARMPERQVAGNADHQIERERHDDIGADRHELAHDHAGDHAVRLQEVNGDESDDHERVRV